MNRKITISAWIAIIAALSTESIASAGTGGVLFGAACQQDFDDNWLDEYTGAWSSCSSFLSRMSTIGSEEFYVSLRTRDSSGVKRWTGAALLNKGQDAYPESVDILFMNTHMGQWDSDGADIAGYDNYDNGFTRLPVNGDAGQSKKMELGNGSRGLSVLALSGCGTLAPRKASTGSQDYQFPEHDYVYSVRDDMWPRWSSAFAGGLRMVVGTWDNSMFNGNAKIGDRFGKYLVEGKTIREAWRRANKEADGRNNPAVMVTGNSSSDCAKRRDEMKVTNLSDYPRRTGSSLAHYCFVRWE